MARTLNRLTTKQADALGAGRHADGGGLYLERDDAGRSSWVFMWSRSGKRREMGLGRAGSGGVSLAAARKAATTAREVLEAGGDPIVLRDAARVIPARVPTFGEVADDYVSSLSPQWRNEKHRAQWVMTLKVYAAPLRPMPVDEVTTEDVLNVLKPIWSAKPETASRLRGRIERVLHAAKARGLRSGENPAFWRGHLDHLLPKRQKLSRGHHAAMPYAQLSAFIEDLRARKAMAACALEFLILTAARSGEVFGAVWNEIDMEAGVWTVPATRMKGGREHRVPLSNRAKALLQVIRPLCDEDGANFVFPGRRPGRPLSSMAMEMLLRRMGLTITPHGFRSSFRTWVAEETTFARELAEASLSHLVGDAVERAYRRGDVLERRRELMQAWAGYVEPTASRGNVVTLRIEPRVNA